MGGVGCDTLGLSLRVSKYPRPMMVDRPGKTASRASLTLYQEDGLTPWTRKLEGGGFMSWGEFDGWVWVEASLPKRRSGENVEPVPWDEVGEAAAGLVDEVEAEGARVVDVPSIVRADAVRDFDGVWMKSGLLRGLARTPVKWSCKSRHFASEDSRGRTDDVPQMAETLVRGNKSRSGLLYDKDAEVGRDLGGQLRFEARLRGPVLRARGVSGVADTLGIEKVGRECFDWLGWGSRVVTGREFVELVATREREPGKPENAWSASQKGGLLGWIAFGCPGYRGRPGVKYSRASIAQYRRWLAGLGIIADEDLDAPLAEIVELMDPTCGYRLDYERGRAFAEAA